MGSLAHLTPRYIINRARVWVHERRHPELPWLTATAVALLDTLLRPDDVGIEWGSGRSTVWFARRLKHLTSIESDTAWYARVKAQLAEKNIQNVTYKLLPVDEVNQLE